MLLETFLADVVHQAILTEILSDMNSMDLAETTRTAAVMRIKVFINDRALRTLPVGVVILLLHLTIRIY
jgi:hypothetical protein